MVDNVVMKTVATVWEQGVSYNKFIHTVLLYGRYI